MPYLIWQSMFVQYFFFKEIKKNEIEQLNWSVLF